MTNKPPTDAEKLAVLEDYSTSINHLKNMGLIQSIDGGVAVRITERGKHYMEAIEKLKDYDERHHRT